MGENTGSRYGIIERLTTAKLEILEEKYRLGDILVAYKDEFEQAQKDYVAWEESFEAEKQKERQEHERNIEKLRSKIKNLESSQSEKEKMLTTKIEQLDEALKQIKEISKESANKE